MLLAYGAGPDAELMASTRALLVAGGLAPPGGPKGEAHMLSDLGTILTGTLKTTLTRACLKVVE